MPRGIPPSICCNRIRQGSSRHLNNNLLRYNRRREEDSSSRDDDHCGIVAILSKSMRTADFKGQKSEITHDSSMTHSN
jgi:hypothetical protein